jgi:putative DNA primase/helicase
MPNYSLEELEEILKTDTEQIVLRSGKTFQVPEQEAIFRFIQKRKPHLHLLTDIATSELIGDCFKNKFRYCPELGDWFVYNGVRWVRDTAGMLVEDDVKTFVSISYLYSLELPDGSDEDKKAYRKYVIYLSTRSARDKIIRDTKSEVMIKMSTFDADPYIMNCKNGTVNLRTGELHKHVFSDYLTMVTDCEYNTNPEIDGTRWNDFIKEITCDDQSVATYLQQALGYSLLGTIQEECMFIAHGKTTRNGKGTLLNTIYKILGDYSKAMPVDFICTTKNGGGFYDRPNPMLASLRGVRFITLSESDSAGKLDEASIKNYTGGDPVATRNLYERSFDFIPQFKMWLSCNSMPVVHDKSIFSGRRVKVIEFNRHFNEVDCDRELKTKFLKDNMRSYIFKWLLDGCKEYLASGLKTPEVIAAAVAEYEKDNDRVRMFYEEMCEYCDQSTDRVVLYTAYKKWCTENGMGIRSSNSFYKEFDRFAVRYKTHTSRVYKNVRLINVSNINIITNNSTPEDGKIPF